MVTEKYLYSHENVFIERFLDGRSGFKVLYFEQEYSNYNVHV